MILSVCVVSCHKRLRFCILGRVISRLKKLPQRVSYPDNNVMNAKVHFPAIAQLAEQRIVDGKINFRGSLVRFRLAGFFDSGELTS